MIAIRKLHADLAKVAAFGNVPEMIGEILRVGGLANIKGVSDDLPFRLQKIVSKAQETVKPGKITNHSEAVP